MKKMRLALAGLVFAALPLAATASPVGVGTWYEFGFDGVGLPLISGTGFIPGTNPATTYAPAGPWEFTLTSAATLFVLDLFMSVDQFEIFNFGTSLGTTTAATDGGGCNSDLTCAIADLRYSRGSFLLSAGSYSITGTQVAGIAGAGAFIVQPSTVPVPAAGMLLAGAIGLLGALRRRKAKAA